MAAIFTRFSETINLKENKKIFSIAVKPFITDIVWMASLFLLDFITVL
jgi:hypothetical protein